jgi:hypothetical protein
VCDAHPDPILLELEHYEQSTYREREVFLVGQLPDDLIADIEAAEYDAAPR